MILDKFKKVKNNYYCFYDSEFNAYDDGRSMTFPQEIVSMGVCITNDKGVIIEKFYSLIALKAAKKVSFRCTDITGIKTKDLKDADGFEVVTVKMMKLLKKYNISRVYSYGLEDRRIFEKNLELYKKKRAGKYIMNMLYDVRQDFKKKTKGLVGDQGIQFLKSICELDGVVQHDALQDAIDLAMIYHKLFTVGYNQKIYEELSKEREETSSYKRNRRVKEENATIAPKDILDSKNKIIDYLGKTDIPNMDTGAKKAFIDDLNLLLIGE